MEFFGKFINKKKNGKTSYDIHPLTKEELGKFNKNKKHLTKNYQEAENLSEMIRIFSKYFKGFKQNENEGNSTKTDRATSVDGGYEKNHAIKDGNMDDEEPLLVDFEISEPAYDNRKPIVAIIAEIHTEPLINMEELAQQQKVGLLVEKYENLFVSPHKKPFRDLPNVYCGKRY